MNGPRFQATQWIMFLLILIISSCSGKVVVKNCEHIKNEAWVCEEI